MGRKKCSIKSDNGVNSFVCLGIKLRFQLNVSLSRFYDIPLYLFHTYASILVPLAFTKVRMIKSCIKSDFVDKMAWFSQCDMMQDFKKSCFPSLCILHEGTCSQLHHSVVFFVLFLQKAVKSEEMVEF